MIAVRHAEVFESRFYCCCTFPGEVLSPSPLTQQPEYSGKESHNAAWMYMPIVADSILLRDISASSQEKFPANVSSWRWRKSPYDLKRATAQNFCPNFTDTIVLRDKEILYFQ